MEVLIFSTIMEEEFTTYASENVMVSNITYERAEALAERIRALEGVADVGFDDTPAHYTRASALLSVRYAGPDSEAKVREARDCKNPQTGETVHVASHKVPHFKAGKGLKDSLL